MKTYDPKKLVIVVGGVLISGFSPDSVVSVKRNEPSYKLVVGADGEGTHSRTNDRSGKITISLAQTSASNAVLSGFALADEQANAGVVPVTIADLNGKTLYQADNAWVSKPPKGRARQGSQDSRVDPRDGRAALVRGREPGQRMTAIGYPGGRRSRQ